ncbi:hypothetical protein [Flavobacterium collinsii]|uniref:Uncharacterized protein n=1 Tax=Flavobacterium collinsii TaxID=1114861 RepID=A0ABN7ES61_9FLAO|nr:hypothetical protein [Flavobacterium collinsii]CAA9202685.1 hypothetical protein FLACOL7796_04400 [Flavobacterium collinsii]
MSRNYKFRNSESSSRNVPHERIRAGAWEMNLDDAHQLVKEVYGIDLPKNIGNNAPGNSAEEITRTMTHSTLEQSYEFYKKATKYNIKK